MSHRKLPPHPATMPLVRAPHPATFAQPKPAHPAVAQRALRRSSTDFGGTLRASSRAPTRDRVLRTLEAPRSPPVQRARAIQRSSSDTEEIHGSLSLFDDDDAPPPEVRTTLTCNVLRDHIVALADTPRVILFDPELNGAKVKSTVNNVPDAPIPQGVIQVSATLRSGLLDLKYHPLATPQSFAVYWLPWSDTKTNFVSWSDLDHCGANCFMTVPLSGCCLVVADTGIVHVTADAYRFHNQRVLFRLEGDRDAVGAADWPEEYAWGLQAWEKGYAHDKVASRGMVFGFQVSPGTWRIYFLARTTEEGTYTWTRGVQAD